MKNLSASYSIALATFGSFSLLIGAFIFQAFGYAPCAMCLWQRWPHGVAIVIGILFFITNKKYFLPLGAISVATTGGIGAFHVGVEQKWWEGPSSCTNSGNAFAGLSGNDLLPSAPLQVEKIVFCDDIVWELFGISMAGYNFLISIALVALWINGLRRA